MELFNKIQIKDMKSVAVFALTLWTISSPALAAFRTSCVDDVFCADAGNGGFANAVCVTAGTDCVCSDAYKANGAVDACVAKGLTDTCAANSDCAGVTNAVCGGTSNACECSAAHKVNGAACDAKGLTDTCAANSDCAGVTNAVCGGTSNACECSAAHKVNGAACDAKGLTDTCTDVADCAGVTNAVCDGTSSVCVCSGAYKDNSAGDGCEAKSIRTGCAADGSPLAYCTDATLGDPNAVCGTTDCECSAAYTAVDDVCVENGARDMTANIGLLCAILMMLSYVNTL